MSNTISLSNVYTESLGLFRDALCYFLRGLLALATIGVLHAALLLDWAGKGLALGVQLTAPKRTEGRIA